MKVPWVSRERIAEKALALIEDFQAVVGYAVKPPIPVEDIIERALELRLSYDDLEEKLGVKDVLGATYVKSRLICVNERLFEPRSEGRLVFTCAHEAGHWILHRQYADIQGRTSPKKEAIVCRLKDAREPIEWQADYFAACLLMPEKEVRETFEKVCGPEPLVLDNVRSAVGRGPLYVEPCVEHWPFIAAAMCEAGGFSNVSKQAMVIRLQELRLLVNLTPVNMNWQALCSSG